MNSTSALCTVWTLSRPADNSYQPAVTMGWAKTSILSLIIVLLILINLIKILLKPLWRFLLGSRVPVIVRTPEDRFEGLAKLGYDFKENYLRSELPT